MKAATYPNASSSAITSKMNGFNQHAATLIQSKNLLFNNLNTMQLNTMQLQNQLRHQQLIQQQLFKLQLQQSHQSTSNCYQMVSPASSPKAMDIQQPSMSPVNFASQPMEQTPMQSPLNTSNSSSMELPIVNQSVQCSSVNTSCENSLIMSPVSTPNCSPVNCVSPPAVTSSPLPVQSINQPISALLSNADHYQTISQLFNQNENRPNKLNLMLPDGQLMKKCAKRKSNPKMKNAIKLENNKHDITQLKNEKLKQKAKQRTAANERERKRMSNINQAFNRLRNVLISREKDTEKLSKMDILKLAQQYINELTYKLQ